MDWSECRKEKILDIDGRWIEVNVDVAFDLSVDDDGSVKISVRPEFNNNWRYSLNGE